MQVAGSVALVTGASSGIGAATARALADAGASVVAVARRADRLAEVAREYGTAMHAHPADIGDPRQAEGAVTAAIDAFGRLDVVVNNAGISLHRSAVHTTADEMDSLFAVNFFGAVRTTMAALPGMLERNEGVVVNVTSVAGYLPNPNEAAYGATKAALSRWTHGLALDLHGTGVAAVVVSPGPIDTDIWERDGSAGAYTGKLFAPEVVARAILSAIERPRVQLTVPRRFGLPGAFYPLMGRPMRWGLRRYGAKH